ncbi:sulfotransferase [Steroidobacter sp. S1-65]|uniref:Sulfotransferase n=1 Tax=Steroidobacter gossypii TaxID=2805490 RepID=A0ABS1WZD6_9GAMM|nr:sulfotransferase [Steroidobacter gossypii]MBM0106340.1 sulfotransferase [Steroidobacter gossypii]
MSDALNSSLQRAREALACRDLPGAYLAAQSALRANPRDAQTHALLGVVLSELNDLSSGEWHLRRALELDTAHAAWLTNLAINLIRQGRAEEAGPCFERADALAPGNLQVLAQWSKLHEMQGDLRRAHELLDRAAAVSSARDVELLRVSYLIRDGEHQQALSLLERAPDLNGSAQLERGRLYDRLGRHGEAWHDWIEGKSKLARQAGSIEYQAQLVQTFVARMKQFFVRANLELLPRATVRWDTAQPVFIIGLPRSGTTLVEQVLACHSAVQAGGELTFVGEWSQFLQRICPDAAPFPENLARMWSADYRHAVTLLRDYYLSRAESRGLLRPGAVFFTDKMPFNEMWLPLMCLAFPNARIVRVVRHPLDVCVSMLSHELTHGFNCGYRIETIAQHLCAMFDLAQHYRRELDCEEFTLRYEDLVRQPEQQVRQLLQYLELPFEPACLSFHEKRRYAATPSYAQVTEALHERSVFRHRHYLEQLAPYMAQLTPWLTALGYAPEPDNS